MTLLNPPSYSTFTDFTPTAHQNGAMSLSQCTRAIIHSGGEYAVGYYDSSNAQCFACSNVSVVQSSFTSNARMMAVGNTSNQLIVSRPKVVDSNSQTSSSSNSSSSSSKPLTAVVDSNAQTSSSSSSSSSSKPPTASTLYLDSLSKPWAMAGTILDQSEDIQSRLMVVLKRYKYAIDLDANRYLIDQGLESFYGGMYKSGISTAIDTVLSDLKTSVIKYRTSGKHLSSFYVDTDRMMEKISSMSNDSTRALSNTLQSLKDATTSYVNLYAPFLSAFPQKLADIISIFGGCALFFAYGTYVTLVRMQFVKERISRESMLQRIIVSTCLLTVCLFVTETMLTQSALKYQHNLRAMSENSMMLIGATVRINDEFSDLLLAIQNWNETPGLKKKDGKDGKDGKNEPEAPSAYNAPRAKAVAFLADCKGVIDKFDACNTITAQQNDLPLPLTEIFLYGIVGCGVLVFAAVCVNSIQPSERVQSIGNINRLITRITDGDSGAIQEAKTIVDCARPPVNLEQMMSWLGITVFACLTAWFAAHSVLALNMYKSNLEANPNCS